MPHRPCNGHAPALPSAVKHAEQLVARDAHEVLEARRLQLRQQPPQQRLRQRGRHHRRARRAHLRAQRLRHFRIPRDVLEPESIAFQHA